MTSSLKSTVATKAEFVYVTYIHTTAEEAWKALTQGDITRQYWGYENRSDWKRGSDWEHRKAGEDKVMLVGKVEEINPPNRLVLTWAEPKDAGDPAKASRVTFNIESLENQKMIRLTVIHDQLEEGSKMAKDISQGWPRVLSSLKSFLETGRPLETWSK